jgi:YVTN family beta-propeller protein
VTGTVTVEFRPVKVAVSPDSKQAFVSNSFSESVSVINLETLIVTRTIPAFSEGITNPDGVALLGGQRLYVALFGNQFSNKVQVFSTLTPTLFAEIEVGEGPFAIAVTPPR